MFFGVPNTGSKVANDLQVILKALKTAKILENEKIVGLMQNFKTLHDIEDNFMRNRHIYNIPVVCCCDKKRIGPNLVRCSLGDLCGTDCFADCKPELCMSAV